MLPPLDRPPPRRRIRRVAALIIIAVAALVSAPVGAGILGARPMPPSLLVARAPGPPRTHTRFPAAEWAASGGTDGAHYTPLTEISRDNVSQLRVAWTYRTGDVSDGTGDTAATAFQATPLMTEGTLIFPTPFSRVIALDAETGAEQWIYDPRVDVRQTARAYVTSRGVALWRDGDARPDDPCARRVIVATVDARLIAIDARSGMPCTTFGRGGEVDLRDGVPGLDRAIKDYRQTAPPTVVGNTIIVGSSIVDNWRARAPSGVVRGFDARTGALRWSWEPLVDVVSVDSAGREQHTRVGAANAWATMSVDTVRGIVFIPTGSASPDHYGVLRPGANRHANSIVALDALTGRVMWAFQLVHHDLWDYDVASQPALTELTIDGRRLPVVIASSKAGSVFVLHRETGVPVFPVEERAVPASDIPGEITSPTQPFTSHPPSLAPHTLRPEDAWGLTPIDRAWCRKRIRALRSEGVFTPPSLRGTIVTPGFVGGTAWNGYAIDHARGLLITVSNRLPSVVTLRPRRNDAAQLGGSFLENSGAQVGTPYESQRDLLLSPLRLPCSAPPWGTLVAVDLVRGAVRWETPLGTMRDLAGVPTPAAWGSVALGGSLVTAGGVAFVGASMDRRLRAFDVETGRVLWEGALPASAQATPMTYRARAGGRQYVVIAAGGHALMRSALGDYVVAFALP